MRKLLRAIWRLITIPFRWIRTILREVRQFFTEDPEDAPLADSIQKAVENPQSILIHIDALRKHLMRAVAALALTTIFSFAFATRIIDILAQPVGGIKGLVAIDPTSRSGFLCACPPFRVLP